MKKFLLFLILLTSVGFNFAQTFGNMDNAFDSGIGTDLYVSQIAIQSDGKIVMVGDFSSYNGNATGQVIRLNADGTHDNTFITSITGQVKCVAIQNDGKILIGGGFSHVNGVQAMRVARLNTDGSLDNTFSTGAGMFSGLILSIQVLFDGTIVAAGTISLFNDLAVANIVKLNSNGSVAAGSYGANYPIYDMAVQPNGKILICGSFTQYNGTTRNRVARLNADLSLETTFDPVLGPDELVSSIALQNNGKILILGDFMTYNGVSKKGIARLNSDGTLDNTFDSGTGPNDSGYEMTIMSNNKIIIGGGFTSFNGTPMNHLVVLNNDGTVDNSFDPGTGPNNTVYAIIVQNDAKILIGGKFTSYNGTNRTGITRLVGESTLNVEHIDAFEQILLQPNPANNIITVTCSVPTVAVITSVTGAFMTNLDLTGETTIDVSNYAQGIYFIRTSEGHTLKFIKE